MAIKELHKEKITRSATELTTWKYEEIILDQDESFDLFVE